MSTSNNGRLRTPDVANGVPGRLRRVDEEQAGQEMAHVAMFGDGVHGLLFSMSTDLVDPAAPNVSYLASNRVQLALVPFALVRNPDGTIAAKPDFAGVTATGIVNTAQTGGALQRDGVWLAAIDLTKTGPASILWTRRPTSRPITDVV